MYTNNADITLVCRSCHLSSTQVAGARPRTICPHCAELYDNPSVVPGAGLRPVSLVGENGGGDRKPSRRRPHSGQYSRPANNAPTERFPALQDRNEKEKPGGRLNSIANFFKKLNPNSRKDGGSRNSSPAGDQKHHSRDDRLGGKWDESDRHHRNGHSSGTTTLPPIPTDSSSRLTSSGRYHNPPSYGQVMGQLPTSESTASMQSMSYAVKTLDELRAEANTAKDNQDWRPLQDYYAWIFDSFQTLNLVFKYDASQDCKSTEDSGIDFELVFGTYSLLTTHPQEVQKAVLKAVINSLLKDKRPQTRDDLRAYLILLMNPQFRSIPTYMIYAHLLRQIATLSDTSHHYLVHWFRRMDAARFRELVVRLQKFISCRLFPPKPEELPPMAKCSWWIPSATKVLALLNAASNLSQPPLTPYMEFYNVALDHLDLLAEYYTWQSPNAHAGFSFCQYPFILSITAKRTILQRDSEQQMVQMARRSLVAKVQQRQVPDIGMLFLNLTVRRSFLVYDSLNEIASKQLELKKKLKVTFAGEPGLDMGGLTKEWFLLLIRQIFQPEYGMFTYDKASRVFWFSSAPCDNYQEFNLVGVLMGLAVYNSTILDIQFPHICYRKLLSPAVVPYNVPNATVGIAKVTLDDLKQTFPDLGHGLQELLDYEGDVEEDFGLTFQVTHLELGSVAAHTLKPGGEEIPVTNSNRHEYVQLYADFLLNGSIYRQFQAFYHGFHSVCASNALIMLRPEEVELLVCGNPSLNMEELPKVTAYDGFTSSDETIKCFWDVVLNMDDDLKKQLLRFVTGSDRIPVGGMAEMTFKITRVDNVNMLPMSHTCFNQLVLPAYRSRKTLKEKLMIAIQNAEGFGLE